MSEKILSAEDVPSYEMYYSILHGVEEIEEDEDMTMDALDQDEDEADEWEEVDIEIHDWPSQERILEFEESVGPASAAQTDAESSVPSSPSHLSSSLRVSRWPLRDNEIEEVLEYGSEQDEDDDEDRQMGGGQRYAPIPRTIRVYMEDIEEYDDDPQISAVVNMAWPPIRSPPQSASQDAPASVLSPGPTATSPGPTASLSREPLTTNRSFDFQWTAFSNPQIPPEERREPFLNLDCGPTSTYRTPYEAFTAIWDKSIMERIVKETNTYAQQLASAMEAKGTLKPKSRIKKWVDTTIDEVFVFFSVTMAMSIVIKARIEEYWNVAGDIFSTPGFTLNITIDRFLLLSRCIHFNDNRSEKLARLTPKEAKIFKLQPILDHLNRKFSTLYVLDRNIALDESLTMWKGYFNIKQRIPNKAAKSGIKTYEVCESATGYLWRFEIHAGPTEQSNRNVTPLSGTTPTIVLRLLHGLENKGYTVWMDRYYNSPALARELKNRGFDCVGTLRTDRELVPTDIHNLREQEMRVGQACGCTAGDVDIVLWRDTKRIALISTYHGISVTRSGDRRVPSIIHDYSVCMGGVDLKDQLLSSYPVERCRTKIWYKKLFKRFLNVSVSNAFIMYKKNHEGAKQRVFRKTLIQELLERHKRSAPPAAITADTNSSHVPQKYPFVDTQCKRNKRRSRRNCVICKKLTTTFCVLCEVALCVPSCFYRYRYHTRA